MKMRGHYEFVCPFCFGRGNYTGQNMFDIADDDRGVDGVMLDTQVHFRSEYMSDDEKEPTVDNPVFLQDLEKLKAEYQGGNKEEVLEWLTFRKKDDVQYTTFWKQRGGIPGENEKNVVQPGFGIPIDSQDVFNPDGIDYREFTFPNSDGASQSGSLDVLATNTPLYRYPVIDPLNPDHQKYLKKQGKDYFIRDRDGMVCGIELKNGIICQQRLCRNCHNPLPTNYGKYEVKYINVIGIAGAGKTVYLSRLIDGMADEYAPNIGLTAQTNSSSVEAFLRNNRVRAKKKLPAPTPYDVMQQPLFYEMTHSIGENTKEVHTLVLYDIAGEMFGKDSNGERERKFDSIAQYVAHADGILLLLDPIQFPSLREMHMALEKEKRKGMKDCAMDDANHNADDDIEVAGLSQALDKIRSKLPQEKGTSKSKVPIAVCITKSDLPEMEQALGSALFQRLKKDVEPVRGKNGLPLPVFNAENYKPIEDGLRRFMQSGRNLSLDRNLDSNYENYDYFAFTALGCSVGPDKYGVDVPQGPILPRRIEEPLYWLFCQFGFVSKNALLHGEYRCPNPDCNQKKIDNEEFVDFYDGGEKAARSLDVRRPGHHWFKKENTVSVNRRCRICGCFWMNDESDPENNDTIFYRQQDVIRINGEPIEDWENRLGWND